MGIAADTLPDLLALLREAVAWGDVVVLSGGVSVGAHDHVKAAFSGIGQLDVWRVAIKPGRPFAFGRAAVDGRPAYLFGLPGNPVSVFVTFELFVRPVLRRLAGQGGSIGRPERIVRVAERIRGSSGAPDDRPRGPGARSGPPGRPARAPVGRPGLAHAVLAGDRQRAAVRATRHGPRGRRPRRSPGSCADTRADGVAPRAPRPSASRPSGQPAPAGLRSGRCSICVARPAVRSWPAPNGAGPEWPVAASDRSAVRVSARASPTAGGCRPLSPRWTAGTGRGDRRRAR